MTIKDLARESGYSVGTVSRVLNDHPNVSEQARQAVMAIVKARGFELNTNAKNLKQTRGNSILVVVKGRGNDLFADMVEQLQESFSGMAYPLIIDYIDELANEVHRAAMLCREKKPMGILFLGGSEQNFREEFDRIDVPAVLITGDAKGLHFHNLSSVTTDDCKAAACAVEYLIKSGHRDIAVLGGVRDLSDISRDRFRGCLDAFARNGLSFDESRYHTCRFSFRSGYDAMTEALEHDRPFTAVFAMSDVMAIGAIRAIRERGLRVPEDISVMGYDGLNIGDFLLPQLTTITQSAAAMAQKGAEILLACIEKDRPACHVCVPFTLSCKESVKSLQ